MIRTAGRIERPDLNSSPLATVASFDTGCLNVYTTVLQSPAPPWQSHAEEAKDPEGFYFAGSGSQAVLVYPSDTPRINTTALIMCQYLEESHIPFDLAIRPFPQAKRDALHIQSSLASIAVRAGRANRAREYVAVETAQFIGSALYTVFHTVKRTGAAAIREVKCWRNPPKTFPPRVLLTYNWYNRDTSAPVAQLDRARDF